MKQYSSLLWAPILFLLVVLYLLYVSPPTMTVAKKVQVLLSSGEQTVATTSTKIPFENIQFTGDIMLGRNVEKLSNTFGTAYPYALLPQVSSTTALVGNFEASIPIKHVSAQSGTFSFSVDKKFIPPLHDYGFDFVSLANNHSYDHGTKNFEHTNQALKEEHIKTFGDQVNQASSTIEFVEVGDATIALVGVYAVYARPSLDELSTLLTRAKFGSDIQIVYVHWGDEYEPIHNAFQESLAYDLIDLGADAVIGHHPHVIQDIGLYKNAPIFYSLGNFIFDQYFSEEVQTGLVVTLTPEQGNLSFSLSGVTSLVSRSQPKKMNETEQMELLHTLAKRSDTNLQEMIRKSLLTFTK